ncbi:unnamed protein product [Clonostachys rosea]|uniref:Metallo-beta-lactamase domain-containing protein n=1 Tax=Bionectria ochroleuca TaxID=29856 RepID=A0ABY6UQE1_BIOOC|nr:unnamed protein product [Clonostachys rosea]
MPLMSRTLRLSTAIACLFIPRTTLAQSNVIKPSNYSNWFPVTSFPEAQKDNLSYWQAEAQTLAGADLWADYQQRCINNGQKYPEIGSAAQIDGFVEPGRPFDSLFFVGASSVSSWAIDTGDGLILIDSMWNPGDAEKVIIPGLEAFGYNGSSVKALLISHEHVDHFGGAKYLQETYNIPAYASQQCWDTMSTIEGTPAKQHVVRDGDELTIGNTTISIVHTPGHTPGTISFLVPVYDRGVRYLAGIYGGGGVPTAVDAKNNQIQSFQKFQKISRDAGVDVLLGTHQAQDHTLQYLDVLNNRKCDGLKCSLPNPYIVGNERYVRWLRVMEMCVRIHAARTNQFLSV